ncbi:hypothetical protein CXB51_025835 [Gossypium anomalum]|uniref:MPBQ/MBSQ family SAM-binding methyltransferase profile domain-containing protein n=1 Tax=Gossypium anomalum TaxID=47600 RepID=A0A8J6CN45_9ROSI|nr:hypothetical protein CXB51_025835 [Gossypium anomalum]
MASSMLSGSSPNRDAVYHPPGRLLSLGSYNTRKKRLVLQEYGSSRCWRRNWFTTLGIVKHVDAKNVTILDQSPHQLAKAKQKEPLKECQIIEGDAEDLPFPTDFADRYVSAGSIEYWPDPQRGIKEAYRVLKIGGKACLIGPVPKTFWLSRFFADVWMLFPKEEENILMTWLDHGLLCPTGVKPFGGDSPLKMGPKAEDVQKPVHPLVFLSRFILGTIVPKGQPI